MTNNNLAEVFCSAAPSQEDWLKRRDEFMGFGLKFHNLEKPDAVPERFKTFERELERCYCSRAYIACVVIAASIQESCVMFQRSVSTHKDVAKFLEYIDEDIKWLRETRNKYMHAGKKQNEMSLEYFVDERDQLESDARRAAATIYHIARAMTKF
ncbi:TPA: hypothetical protein ACPJ1T_004474 [Vibrio diabolicus]